MHEDRSANTEREHHQRVASALAQGGDLILGGIL